MNDASPLLDRSSFLRGVAAAVGLPVGPPMARTTDGRSLDASDAARGSILLPLLVLFGACGGKSAGLSPTGDNLVLVVIDTYRADHFAPGDGVPTPHLDRLAEDGLVFDSAFAHAAMTLPAHTALFSSRYPHRAGVVGNGDTVGQDLPLLAEWLAGHGYATRAAVSIGTLHPRFGIDRGFEEYLQVGGRFLVRAEETYERLDSLLAELQHEEPFFLFAHFSDPHAPCNAHGTVEHTARISLDGEAVDVVATSEMTHWESTRSLEEGTHTLVVTSGFPFNVRRLKLRAGDENVPYRAVEGGLRERVDRLVVRFELERATDVDLRMYISDWPASVAEREARYALEVNYADQAVGALLGRLEERGLYDSSLIVFTSDHGEGLGEHGHAGHARYLYDEALHVPLAIKLPEGSPFEPSLRAARSRLVRHVDLVPTILAVLGLPPLPGQMGAPLHEDAERILFAETRRPVAPETMVALRDDRYKLIYNVDDESFELYDLRDDPEELENLFPESGHLREEWIPTLRALAAAELPAERELDQEELERLQALGYMADGPEETPSAAR